MDLNSVIQSWITCEGTSLLSTCRFTLGFSDLAFYCNDEKTRCVGMYVVMLIETAGVEKSVAYVFCCKADSQSFPPPQVIFGTRSISWPCTGENGSLSFWLPVLTVVAERLDSQY